MDLIIPAWLLKRRDVTLAEKLVLCYYMQSTNRERTYMEIARLIGLGERTINNSVSSLRKSKLLEGFTPVTNGN